MSKNKIKSTTLRTMQYFWQEMKQHKLLALGAVLTTPIVIFSRVALVPYIVAQIIQHVATGDIPQDQLWEAMTPYIIILVASYLIGSVLLGELRLYFAWKMEARVQYGLANKCFEALSKQSMGFHNDRFGGSLVSQAGKFVGAYGRLSEMVIWTLLPFILAIVYVAVILWQEVPLYVVCLLAFVAIYTVIAYLSFRKLGELNKKEADAENKRSGRLSDAVTNILAVKSYAKEKYEQKGFATRSQKVVDASLNLMRAFIARDAAFSLVVTCIIALSVVFLVGGPSWFGIPIATLVLIFTYTTTIVNELWSVGHIFREYNRSFGDAYEMTKILDLENEVEDVESAEALVDVEGKVELTDVNFKHLDGSEQVFEHLNLHIPAGQRVGLVGRSGSGKTTLTKLLLRFADVQEGAITIDGQNVGLVTQESLRENIAYVPQETTLFHRSIADNIAYGKPKATRSEIIKAANQANAWEFIKNLPDGLDTLTGERGVKLSGGQRQRVAIARAILKNAPILILDEATASLDTESEKLIQEAMKTLMKNRTSIVVAHRLSTVAELDRIIVLEHGKIVEDGSHKALLKKKGIYSKLWNKQTGKID